ncbi:MAG: ion channel, partial [bacterium]
EKPIWIQAIYFSTATICTVGFGDINVKGSIAQLVCTSEMVMGFIIIVLLLTAFSATVNVSED